MNKSKYSKILTKDFLMREYIKNKKPCSQIAYEVGCSLMPIFYWLKMYNIPRRTRVGMKHSKWTKRKMSIVAKKRTGKLASNYRHGRHCLKHFCIDCDKEVGCNSVRCIVLINIRKIRAVIKEKTILCMEKWLHMVKGNIINEVI